MIFQESLSAAVEEKGFRLVLWGSGSQHNRRSVGNNDTLCDVGDNQRLLGLISGDSVMDGSSKLSLTTSSLCQLNRAFSLLSLEDTVSDSFGVRSLRPSDSVDQQFRQLFRSRGSMEEDVLESSLKASMNRVGSLC